MSKQHIRDRSNRLMATTEIKSSGKHESGTRLTGFSAHMTRARTRRAIPAIGW